MEWNDLEQDTPSIRSLLYDRGGLLFEEHASFEDYDAPEDDWSDELPSLDTADRED
jgi:hypothetical protein